MSDSPTVRVHGRQLWCARCPDTKVRGRGCPACATTVSLSDLTSPEARRAALKAAGWQRHSRGPGHTETWTHRDHHSGAVSFATAWRAYRATHDR